MPTASELLKNFENIKTISPVAVRLLSLIEDKNSTIKELGDVVKLDPTLVARLLRLVNSPYYALLTRIDSIDSAVAFIGMNNLRNMIAVSAVKDIFAADTQEDIFSSKALWFHSAAVGICAKMISERIFGILGEDAFLCGILHDIGMIMEYQAVTDLFLQVCKTYDSQAWPFTACERDLIGTDHCEAGHLLAEAWKIPDTVQAAIKNHHTLSKDFSPSEMSGLIQMADYLVTHMGHAALPGMKLKLSPSLRTHMQSNRDEYKVLVTEMPDELAKAREIYNLAEE